MFASRQYADGLGAFGQRFANETPVPNVNKRRQVTSESSDFAGSSGMLASLITAWLEVRVLPGPPFFAL